MADPKTYYRPGLRFKAAPGALCHQECCFKGAEEVRNADGSLRTEAIRPLWAEFGVYGGEYRPAIIDEHGELGPINDMFTGEPLVFADIRGGYFDLDEQAAEKGWSDNEKEIVARHMLTLLEKPGLAQFKVLDDVKLTPPWPTYDATHHKQIPVLAAQLGLVPQTLAYELQNRKRPEVIDRLREAGNTPPPVEHDESLAAA